MKRCSVTKNQLELGIKQNLKIVMGNPRWCFAKQKLKVHTLEFSILTQQTIRIPHNNFIFQSSDAIFITL